MIGTLGIGTVVALVVWLAIFNVLRFYAAKAVAEDEGGDALQVMAAGRWWRGESRRAFLRTVATLAWFLGVPIVIIAVAAGIWVGR